MVSKAVLGIPRSGNIGLTLTDGLSDEVAFSMGRIAARTLSEQDGPVTVLLQCGTIIVIGRNTLRGKLTIGRLRM